MKLGYCECIVNLLQIHCNYNEFTMILQYIGHYCKHGNLYLHYKVAVNLL